MFAGNYTCCMICALLYSFWQLFLSHWVHVPMYSINQNTTKCKSDSFTKYFFSLFWFYRYLGTSIVSQGYTEKSFKSLPQCLAVWSNFESFLFSLEKRVSFFFFFHLVCHPAAASLSPLDLLNHFCSIRWNGLEPGSWEVLLLKISKLN